MAGLGEIPGADEKSSYEFFGSSQVIEGVTILAQARRLALAAPDPAIRALAVPISQIIVELDAKLRNIAFRTAEVSDGAAKRHLSRNQKRPSTSKGIHLRDCIKSRPGPLGSVNVFLTDELNKAINDGSDKSYWEVIEEGSAAAYPGFLGRVLQGVFVGPGHRDSPRAAYGGDPNPPGSTFEFADPLIEGGRGVISHEIEPVHFLKTGSEAGWAYFAREVSAATGRATSLLNGLVV